MKQIQKIFFSTMMAVAICLIICSPFLVSYFYLPKEVYITAGQEHLFNFDVPLKASILTDTSIVLKTANQEPIDEKTISLSHPFYMMMENEGSTDVTLSFMGVIPLKTVSVQAMPYEEVIPCGKVVGIRVSTKGILVLGVGSFESEEEEVSPCKEGVEVGDLIVACNGQTLYTKEELRTCVEETGSAPLNLTIQRNGEILEFRVMPQYAKTDEVYKIGLWVRDSTQGIGTITYIEPETYHFGALGHGITDSETKKLMPVREGDLIKANITHIKKGSKGDPGEMSGIINYEEENMLGEVENNTALGIYGTVDKKLTNDLIYSEVPIAFQDEVHEGKASILVELIGVGLKEYEVEIQKVSRYSNEPAKGMVIKIVDEGLLEVTNGIVQGMSGSPILQDGKLIGAVTHVFIQDPTRGYGVFIENMINNDKR